MTACHKCRKSSLSRFSAKSHRKRRGFTFLETLVSLGVLGVFFAAVAMILQQILLNEMISRVRAAGTSLGLQKMELVRNLPYTQVGTVGGIPPGPLAALENVPLNGQTFVVMTSVNFIDDPFDGVAPADTVPTDYKRVRVQITWDGPYSSTYPVTFVTNIVPNGIETTAGGGTLFFQVYDASGKPIEGATVNIDNTVVSPVIHTQALTNNNGILMLPGAPACITCYKITITKTGYSTDRTYTSAEVANPLQPYLTVITGQVTQSSFAIDRISSIIVNSLGSRISGYPPISNVLFSLHGAKIIGYDTDDNPVYKFNYSNNTGGGTVTVSGLEWDTYAFDFANSAHNLAGSNPVNPIQLPPATNTTVNIVAVPKTNHSLLVVMQNSAQQLVTSASAELSEPGLGYTASVSAGATGAADMGQAFFGALTPTVYNLKVNANGYQEATASVSISGITSLNMTLNPL